MKLNEHELATQVVNNMGMSGVFEYAVKKLKDFYRENPEDFAAALEYAAVSEYFTKEK